jgi:hypothetical protein
MPKNKVEINGANFLIEMEGRPAKHGFFTTRFVDVPDAAAAEKAAVQMIRETQRLRDLVRNTPDDPPVMFVIGITEIESFAGIENLDLGFAWYEDRPRRWWQFWKG